MYALMGGVAVVGAAVAFHFLSKSSEEVDDALDADLAELGELELDSRGIIEFKQFLKIFQICSFYGKTQFAERKREFINKRRQALKDNDENTYKQIVMSMTQEEELLVQNYEQGADLLIDV